jgi:predicted nucleic-acid-binding protein
MKTGLDTSVVIRLIVGQPVEQALAAQKHVMNAHAAGDEIVVTDTVIIEAYHALHHHYKHPKEVARELLRRMATSGAVLIEPVETLIALHPSQGAGLVDRIILHRYGSLGAETATFDRALAAQGAINIG